MLPGCEPQLGKSGCVFNFEVTVLSVFMDMINLLAGVVGEASWSACGSDTAIDTCGR